MARAAPQAHAKSRPRAKIYADGLCSWPDCRLKHAGVLCDGPFVALEEDGALARVFARPVERIVAWTYNEVEPALARVRAQLAMGRHIAGWMSYEAGIAFEQRLLERVSREISGRYPLLWFGAFAAPERIDLATALPSPEGAWIGAPLPRLDRAGFQKRFDRAKAYIAAGDLYQVNLSYRADVAVEGHPLAAYAHLRASGQARWGGVVFDGARWLLSASPELFFRLDEGVVEARPMKGTAARHNDPAQDRAAAAALGRDPKELAENTMIVDLLRNDVSRLAKKGSVRCPALFTVETYPTFHTMTSTIRADIEDKYDAVDVLRTLFPCGSVTGAPKIRAMEIIDELERDERGPYCGAMGWMSPDGSAVFNVTIRTIAIANGKAELGLGSAIVHDSHADAEWAECATKARFVTRGLPTFELIETMRFEGGEIVRRDLHLQRLGASAMALGFAFDGDAARERLDVFAKGLREACVVRATLAADGAFAVEHRALPRARVEPFRVALVSRQLAPEDFRLRHKTSLRAFHQEALRAADAEEVVYLDRDGFVAEGSYSNVFVERDGMLLTPPLSRGLLPGVLRAALIGEGRAREHDLVCDDLRSGFWLGNSVRGLIGAKLSASVNT